MFSSGTYFKVWAVVNKGNYSEVECSTSKKNNQTGQYETDFSSKYVRFIGNAHTKAPQPNERIKVTSCGVQNCYESNGQKQYLKSPTYLVFDFEREGGDVPNPTAYTPSAYGGMPTAFEDISTVGDGDLPF